MLTAHHHFPAASTSNPGSPTFPHSQSLSLNGAGLSLALRPGSSVGGHATPERQSSLPTAEQPGLPEDPEASRGRSYLDFVKSWDDDQVARWLAAVKVGQYEDVFKSNDIRGNVLLDVDQTALKEMGVQRVGDRVKITVAIKALRARCAASQRAQLSQSRAASPLPTPNSSALPNGSSTTVRRSGSGKALGRIPPPLHLTRSNSVSSAERAQAYQHSPHTGHQPHASLSISSSGGVLSSRPASSPRTLHPPSLPPPGGRPPPPPLHRPATSPTHHSSPSSSRAGPPSISTTAASPTNSFTGGTTGSSNWSGDYGLPRSPAPSSLTSVAYNARTASASPSGDRTRPSTGLSSLAQRSTSMSSSLGRPSTAQPMASPSYSSHPYAASSSPTQDGFSVTTYGRGSPSPSTASSKLLPSPAISAQTSMTSISDAASYNGYVRPTTPGGLPTASSASSLDAVMRKAVKFIAEDGVSKMVAVSDCLDGRDVLERVLKKFQKTEEELDDWGVFNLAPDGQPVRLLSESELFNICRDSQAPERQRGLAVRQISSASQGKRGRKLQWVFGESNPVDAARNGASSVASPTSPNYLGVEIPSTTIEPASPSGSVDSDNRSFETKQRVKRNRASVVSVMSGLGADWSTDSTNLEATPPNGVNRPSSTSLLNSGRKLRNFFGQRPPSELIATHLLEYFPRVQNNKLLSKQVRQSMRRSMIRRDSHSSGGVGGYTSWEKMPDRRSLTPSSYSRMSGSSGGSTTQLPSGDESGVRNAPRSSNGSSSGGGGKATTPPSILESMHEGPEGRVLDDGGQMDADARSIASSRATRSSRRASRASGTSRLSVWDRRSRNSDAASVVTVDEVTAELEERRASMETWADSSHSSSDDGSARPPSIELSLEDDAGDYFDDEDMSDEDDEDDDDEDGGSDDEDQEQLSNESTQTKPALKWIKGALIGAGSFGSVFLGMNPLSGSLMAVKQVELPTGNSHNEERKKSMLDALEREIALLKDLQHDNIVQYLDSSSDGEHLNIFLEYVPGGSVAALLSNYGAFEEALVSKFVRQILTGLDYLHEREIVHRDIKGANILVDNKGGIKISDFGISKRVEDNLLGSSKANRPSLQGSVYWMAPEVVKQTAYTSKADIWSLGCLVVEMLTGAHPWANLTQMQAIFRIGQSSIPTIPDDISSDADDFLEQTFLIDYERRPSARELLLHVFIRDPDMFAASQQTPTRATFAQTTAGPSLTNKLAVSELA